MRFIPPATGAPEIMLAEDQPEYQQLQVALYKNQDHPAATEMVARVRLNDEERALVFGGVDIYISQLVFPPHGYAPLRVSVGEGMFRLEPDGEEGG